MNYKISDYLLALVLCVLFIGGAVVIGVFEPFIYNIDLARLNLGQVVGLDNQTVLHNYRILIEYQSIFFRGPLEFPNFVMSTPGRIHFEEVKQIFEYVQLLVIGAGIVGLLGTIRKLANQDYLFLKLTAIFTVVLPAMLGAVVMIDFDRAFVTFHELAFNNDYWIFDVNRDPIINVLPEEFFMHKFLLIIALIILFAFASYRVYRYFFKKTVTA